MRNAELTRLLVEPSATLADVPWDIVLRQARRSGLLGRLANLLEARGELHRLPWQVRRHFEGARLMAQRQLEAVHWEVQCIHRALAAVGISTFLLKGAAYALADLPPASGRFLSDIDILVPRDALALTESTLMLAGWATTHHDAYDQRYYREWMHELPPMQHIVRASVIDVHHALLPLTARIRVDSAAMRAAAVPIPGHPHLRMLAPADMVLHAAAHLFHEGELDKGLRDLSDLDLLFRHFGVEAGFWEGIVRRAATVGLPRPLYYALNYCRIILGTPVPPAVLAEVKHFGPRGILRNAMCSIYKRALQPNHRTASDAFTPLARTLLFMRSHWLRMPFPLLVYHLGRKSLVLLRAKPEVGGADRR